MKFTRRDVIIFILMYIVSCWAMPMGVLTPSVFFSNAHTLIAVHIAFVIVVPMALYSSHLGAVQREARRVARQRERDARREVFKVLVIASKHIGNLVQICQDEYPPEECASRGITAAAEYHKQLLEVITLNVAEQIAQDSKIS